MALGRRHRVAALGSTTWGTLMEESISRLAGSYHGTRLDPEQRWPPPTGWAPGGGSAPRCTFAAARLPVASLGG
jgi:hypothetical protein